MSIADIVIISIVGLFALIGIAKGFFKSLISLFGWFISMLVAVLAARAVAEALLDVPAIANFVVNQDGGFSLFSWLSSIMPEGLMKLPAGATEAQITAALGTGITGSLLAPFIGLLTGESIAASTATIGQGMALTLAGGLFMVIVGAALFIVCRIIMQLFVMFAKSLLIGSHTGALSRFMGFLLGAVRGALYSCVLLVVIGFLTPFGFMAPVTAQIDAGVISKPVAEQVYTITSKFTANDNYFNKLLELSGMKGNSDSEDPDESYTMTADETSAHTFIKDAFVDNGGLFNCKITSEERPQFNVWASGLSKFMTDSAANISTGALSVKTQELAALLPYFDAAVDPKGQLYQAFDNLTADLSNYFSTDAVLVDELTAKEERIKVDFANVLALMKSSGFETLFGEIQFEGLTAVADLDTLYPDVNVVD